MRTNSCGITEVASIRTDQEKYSEGWDRIFGSKKQNSETVASDESDPEQWIDKKHWTYSYISEDKNTFIIPVYKIPRIYEVENQSEERRVLFEEAVDDLATLRAEVKEDIEFLISLTNTNTVQQTNRIFDIKKKYL